MGSRVEAETARVLEEGLPPLPHELERGRTAPLALWRGNRYGAVLFVRRWKNDHMHYEIALTRRGPDGSWEQPDGWGESAWIDDLLVRAESG